MTHELAAASAAPVAIEFRATGGAIYASNPLRGLEPFALKGVNWYARCPALVRVLCSRGVMWRASAAHTDPCFAAALSATY